MSNYRIAYLVILIFCTVSNITIFGQSSNIRTYKETGGPPTYIQSSAITHCSNGDILIAWYDLNNYSVLSRIDQTGNLIWSKTLQDAFAVSSHTVYSIGENSDGSIWVMGIHVDTLYQKQYFLTELNATGVINWAKFYFTIDNSTLQPPSCYKMYDGGYMINLGVPSYLHILRTDSVGNLLWTANFDTDPNLIKHPGVAGTPTYDGGFLIAGQQNSNVVLVKVNTIGVHQWGTSFNPSATSSTARDVCELNDGHAIVAGISGGKAFLAKVNHLNGDILWFKLYNDTNNNFTEFKYLHPVSDGSFFAIIPSGSIANGDVGIVHVDANGTVINAVMFNSTIQTNGIHTSTMKDNNNTIHLLNTDMFGTSICEHSKVGNLIEFGCNINPLNVLDSNITPPLLSTILTTVWPGTDGIEVTGPIINSYSISNDVTVECIPSEVNEYNNNELEMQPNPFTEQLFIKTTEPIQRIEFYDISGKLLKSANVSGAQLNVETQELPAGVYILRIIHATSASTHRVIKS
jgi:Secretion system C-terminal sorting domain